MKIIYKIKLIVLAMLLGAGSMKAQDEVVKFLNAGVDDAEILFTEYLRPLGAGLGTAITGGWYNTGKPHKLLGFDLTFTGNVVMTPSAAGSFDLSDFTFNSITYDAANSETPTVTGPNDMDPSPLGLHLTLIDDITGTEITLDQPGAFPSPPGSGITMIPLPMLQLGIGLVKNTELNFRFIPKTKLGDFGSAGLWGVGVKHDVLQWLPVVDKIPVDVSIQLGYTKFKTTIDAIDYNPLDQNSMGYMSTVVDHGLTAPSYDDQNLELIISGFTANAIVSKKLAVLTVYGSLGFYSSTFGINLNGDYPIPGPEINTNDITNPYIEMAVDNDKVITDPLAIEVKEKNLRAGIGFRLKLLILTIHGDYTIQEYPMATVGIGFSFR